MGTVTFLGKNNNGDCPIIFIDMAFSSIRKSYMS